jgi:hypothetical protein
MTDQCLWDFAIYKLAFAEEAGRQRSDCCTSGSDLMEMLGIVCSS